jgi:hypothetical protein
MTTLQQRCMAKVCPAATDILFNTMHWVAAELPSGQDGMPEKSERDQACMA